MVTILKPTMRKSQGERLSEGIGRGLETLEGMMRERQSAEEMKQENESLKKEFGIDLSGIKNTKIREKYIDNILGNQKFENEYNANSMKKLVEENRQHENKLKQLEFESNLKTEEGNKKEKKEIKKKYQENVTPLKNAMETIDRMKSLGKKGNLGIGTSVRGIFSPEARKQAAEYERLGKSLISYASNIPIRNRVEFEILSEDLFDPSISDDSREGILNAMTRIIQSSMQQYEMPEDEEMGNRQNQMSNKNARPPLTSFLE